MSFILLLVATLAPLVSLQPGFFLLDSLKSDWRVETFVALMFNEDADEDSAPFPSIITLISFPDTVSNCASSFVSLNPSFSRRDSFESTLFSLFSLLVSLESFTLVVVDVAETLDAVVFKTDVVVVVVDAVMESAVTLTPDAVELKGVVVVVTVVVVTVVDDTLDVTVVLVVDVDVAVTELF